MRIVILADRDDARGAALAGAGSAAPQSAAELAALLAAARGELVLIAPSLLRWLPAGAEVVALPGDEPAAPGEER